MIMQQEEFARRMLVWLNEEVAPKGVRVDADTPLFATRLLDSLKVLELIAFLQSALGRKIPDAQIVLANFRTIGTIARVFAGDGPVATTRRARTGRLPRRAERIPPSPSCCRVASWSSPLTAPS